MGPDLQQVTAVIEVRPDRDAVVGVIDDRGDPVVLVAEVRHSDRVVFEQPREVRTVVDTHRGAAREEGVADGAAEGDEGAECRSGTTILQHGPLLFPDALRHEEMLEVPNPDRAQTGGRASAPSPRIPPENRPADIG
ncbi:hypothetical protein ABTY20_14460 [Streptomyces sp. NPDC126497]|uniref:hypothetical protein n=1 Tax=Streptomyces sp. NPDC126497 TaxID=3155313 RepID=UPI00331AF02A